MKFILYAILAGLGIAFTIFSEEAMASQPGSVTLEWYGHSCFLLTLENGAKILTESSSRRTIISITTPWVWFLPGQF